MKRSYDFEDLAKHHGFDSRQLEKACRISDLLEDLSSVPFLRSRLSLCGGTALAFIYFDEIRRLSIDLDFNYRHLDKRDWGMVRRDIDDRVKRILYAQGYARTDLAITARYPLGRITVQYTNHSGQNDNFMIEIGYMRRIPILHIDSLGTFRHIGTQETLIIMTPQKEELFANKWCTFLYRSSSRDLFDTYQISRMEFGREEFRKCAVVDSLMRGQPPLNEIEVEALVKAIPIDTTLKNLLLVDTNLYEFDKMRQDVIEFSREILDQIDPNERKVIKEFFENRIFNPELMDPEGIFNDRIGDHPMIMRALSS